MYQLMIYAQYLTFWPKKMEVLYNQLDLQNGRTVVFSTDFEPSNNFHGRETKWKTRSKQEACRVEQSNSAVRQIVKLRFFQQSKPKQSIFVKCDAQENSVQLHRHGMTWFLTVSNFQTFIYDLRWLL